MHSPEVSFGFEYPRGSSCVDCLLVGNPPTISSLSNLCKPSKGLFKLIKPCETVCCFKFQRYGTSRNMRLTLVVALLAFFRSPQVTAILLTPDLSNFTSTLERYATSKNDIVFVLDESGSIGAEHFPAELKFTEMVARLLVVSRNFSRLTVMTFSNDNVVHIDQVRGHATDNMCEFAHAVNNIPYRGDGTRTREALEEARRILKTGRVPSSGRWNQNESDVNR